MEHGVGHVGVVVTMAIMMVVHLTGHSTDDGMLVVLVAVVMMVGGLVSLTLTSAQQWLRLLLGCDPGLLQVQDGLLDGQDDEEAATHDELGQGVVYVHVILILDLLQDLETKTLATFFNDTISDLTS